MASQMVPTGLSGVPPPGPAMPEMADTLTPQQVADLAAFLLTMRTPIAGVESTAVDSQPKPTTPPAVVAKKGFSVDEQDKKLRISLLFTRRGKSIL